MTLRPPPSASVFPDGIPSSPPPEVLDAIGEAAAAYDRLLESGRHVHFALHPFSGGPRMTMVDIHGNVLEPVSPRQVLDLAAGEAID